MKKDITNTTRPTFPKRAIITGGMPYGNKELHFGHIGGMFVHADVFTRFLRDRIGKENVIFVSGTDCYGSPIFENYRRLIKEGEFTGTIDEFVEQNHKKQKEVLDAYDISLNFYGASSFGDAADIHRETSDEFINTLYRNGYLSKITTSQFYDSELDVLLNGRQVIGQCPIEGCSSEKAYADECSLGHQYMPKDLINPKSTLTGKKPEMRDVINWYFNLEDFNENIKEWIDEIKKKPNTRKLLIKAIEEFIKPPMIYVKKDQIDELNAITDMPPYTLSEEGKSSVTLIFDNLDDRDKASQALSDKAIRFRTGKTLVPFRLTGNIEWGVPAPAIENIENLTFWVWPESLWAPISFTKAYLNQSDKDLGSWEDWWCSKDSSIYQFIGEDNIYFYGLAEIGMFMGMKKELNLPILVPNSHILFLDKKASSSGKVKPPMAGELLDYYTAEQLRAHFISLGLANRSVGFQPKPLNPKATEKDSDPALKEGNLLTNVFNRVIRSSFYTVQQHYDGKIPVGEVSKEVLEDAKNIILEYEMLMYKYEFNTLTYSMDIYIRNINKYWVKNIKIAEQTKDSEFHKQVIIDTFHMIRTAAILMHPIAPEGTEMLRDYLNFGEEFWSWDRIFDTIYNFMEDKENHPVKFLEPRVDFFEKHPSQLG
ncbi:MAG: class I tRNA ligase family protein [Epulopiscium sp.]|nr:class I tRNA ligase family protein [Candidatus Epulonipiscium sp.]